MFFTDDARPYRDVIVAKSEGGSGGQGGRGGPGNPAGSSGRNGQSGPSAIGWANAGRNGDISIGVTEEFFRYGQTKKNELAQLRIGFTRLLYPFFAGLCFRVW